MRRLVWVTVVLLAVSMMSSVRALPTNEVDDEFFDCALNSVGWHLLACDGHIYQSGVQGGYYRNRITTSCDSGSGSSRWYRWNGTSWTLLSAPPSPSC